MNHTSTKAVAPDLKPYTPPFQWRFLGPLFWPLWLALGALWLLAWWPQRWRVRLARGLGNIAYARHLKRREIIDLNLSWCFPKLDEEQRQALAREYYRYLIQSLFDYGVLWWGSQKRVRGHVQVRGEEHLQRLLAENKAVIIVTGHSPALDRGGMSLAMDYPIISFANEAKNPLVEWLFARRRSRFGGTVFPRGGGFRPVIKGLRQGHVLYILADEDLGPQSASFAPFFGIPRATLNTPLRLARTSGAEILTSFSWYDDSQQCYVTEISPMLEGLVDDVDELGLDRLNQRLEQAIRQHPAQYMWSLRLFKTMQDGSAPPYRMKGRPGSGPRPRPECGN